MRRIRKLDYSRCPWCGIPYDVFPEHPHRPGLNGNTFNKYREFCRSCGKWSEEKYHWMEKVIVVIGVALCICISTSKIEEILILLGLCIFCVPLFGKRVHYKMPEIGKYLGPEERLIGTVRFQWYTLKNGGVGFPRFRIYNHMIFPVCFVDEQDKPVTHTGCVRLCKKYFVLFQGAKLRLVTEVIDAGKVREGMKFYIFNKGERIGEGIVEKYLYRP